jgi:hypothetical protein
MMNDSNRDETIHICTYVYYKYDHTYYKMFETTKQSKYMCISKKKQYRYQFQLLDIMWNPGNIAL